MICIEKKIENKSINGALRCFVEWMDVERLRKIGHHDKVKRECDKPGVSWQDKVMECEK